MVSFITLSGSLFITLSAKSLLHYRGGCLLHHRLNLLHYREVLHYREFITLLVVTSMHTHILTITIDCSPLNLGTQTTNPQDMYHYCPEIEYQVSLTTFRNHHKDLY